MNSQTEISEKSPIEEMPTYINLIRGINRLNFTITSRTDAAKGGNELTADELSQIAHDICTLSDKLTAARSQDIISINQTITLDNHLNRTAFYYTRLCDGYFMRNAGHREN